MALKRCPICGEKYSDTYRDCPFCEEEDALQDGVEIRRTPRRRGKRTARSRQFSVITPTLVLLILIMASLLAYLLYGDQLKEKFGKEENKPPVEEELPPETDEPPVTEDPQNPDVSMPEETPDTPDTPVAPETASDYDAIMALPNGLTLSTTDFSLREAGETHTIAVTGGSGTYTWVSQDEGVASVDASGKVTAVSTGTINIAVTDGVKKGVCIVRVRVSGGSSTETPSTGGALQKGAAIVINGGNGVRVRSGPSTDHEILATLANGSDLKIVESAGNGWYKITFSDVGGVTATGYMKGEFLKNN